MFSFCEIEILYSNVASAWNRVTWKTCIFMDNVSLYICVQTEFIFLSSHNIFLFFFIRLAGLL